MRFSRLAWQDSHRQRQRRGINQNGIFGAAIFAGNKTRVLSKNAIAEHLSGDNAELLDKFDFIYSHMKNLKRKLTEAGSNDYIKTIYGLGYKFSA